MDSDTNTQESGQERELTLNDRGAGIEARVVVDRSGGGPPRVVDIRLRSTDGHGLRSEDLLVLEELGLRMPVSADVYVTPAPVPAAVEAAGAGAPAAPVKAPPTTVPGPRKGTPGKKASPAPAKTAPKKATKSTAKPAVKATPVKTVPAPATDGRVYRVSPPLDELDALFVECAGSPGAMAEKLDVPRHTMHSWLKRHRREGHVFPTVPATVGASTGAGGEG